MLTPREVAAQTGRGIHKVLRWINSGELRATNLGDGKTPRWMVDPEDLESFLASRRNAKPAKATKRTKQATVTEYF